MQATVASLHVYPVKGLAGIALERANCGSRGLEHDRRWMVVDAQGRFLSQRELPRMATIWTDLREGVLELAAHDMPLLEVPLAPATAPTLRVQVWRSECDAAPGPPEADAWLSDYLGLACRLVYMPDTTRRHSNPEYAGAGRLVGFADGYAYLVVGEASLADLNARLAAAGSTALPMNRFRPNLVVRGAPPYAEDGWKTLRAGGAVLGGAKPCGRCEVTTTDQASGERRGPEPLATLATYRESPRFGIMFGMNFVTLAPGPIAVGDPIEAA